VTISVLIADDQALLRGGFRMLVESAPDMSVLGEAADGAEAVTLTRQLHPDVVLMDIRMPGTDGIQATQQVTADPALAGVQVLILTTFDLDEYVYGALRAGASGFVLKNTSPEDLLTAIRVIAAGDALLSPRVTRRLIAEFAQRPQPACIPPVPTSLDSLTSREKDVLHHIARGLSNTEIAQTLHMGMGTVKTHVSRLLAKLGARDRAQLVVIAYESGWAMQDRLTNQPGAARPPLSPQQ
jgi:DNA-binding NarL/FixJ family response regulator